LEFQGIPDLDVSCMEFQGTPIKFGCILVRLPRNSKHEFEGVQTINALAGAP